MIFLMLSLYLSFILHYLILEDLQYNIVYIWTSFGSFYVSMIILVLIIEFFYNIKIDKFTMIFLSLSIVNLDTTK